MLTLYLILHISLGALKSAFRFMGWLFKWMLIITFIAGVSIPLFATALMIMCAVSFAAWLGNIIIAGIKGQTADTGRLPFNFAANLKTLVNWIEAFNAGIEKRSKRSNCGMITPADQSDRPISVDEMILCDVILDE